MRTNEHPQVNQGVVEPPVATATPVPIGCVEPVEERDVDRITRFCAQSQKNHSAASPREASPRRDDEIQLNADAEDDVDCRAMLRLGGNGF